MRKCYDKKDPHKTYTGLFDSNGSRAAAVKRQNSKIDGMSGQSQSPVTTANRINEPTGLKTPESPCQG